MRTAIIGAGGVGGYFGAKLANTGVDVTFLARGDHLRAIEKDGLKIRSILGDFHLKDCQVTCNIGNIEPVDLIILAVKAWQVEPILDELVLLLRRNGLVLSMQNGVYTVDQLLQCLPSRNVAGGVCKILSEIQSPGIINHFGVKPSVVIGGLGSDQNMEQLNKVGLAFKKVDIDYRISKDIMVDIWNKFAFICIGGLLAVHRVPLGTLREFPETRKQIIGLVTEIFCLAEKIGINLRSHSIDEILDFIDALPKETTFSLSRDIWEGQPSELDYQNGAVVQLGEQYGIQTPVNRLVYFQLEPLEKIARAIKTT